MKKKTSVGVREELKRQKRRQVDLLTHLSARLAGVAMLVAVRLPGVSTLTDAGAFLALGETMMANQTLEGLLGTMEQIAKGATAAPEAGDIPMPGTETRQ